MKDVAAGLRRMIAMGAGSGDIDALAASDGLSLWLSSNDSVKLEDALGVANNYRSTLRRRRRDDLYVEIAATCFPDLKGAPLARAIITGIDRYRASAWLRDHETGRRPAGANGLLYDLLALNERLLDVEALRKLPGIFRAGEYQDHDLGFSEQEENCLECYGPDKSIFEGSE